MRQSENGNSRESNSPISRKIGVHCMGTNLVFGALLANFLVLVSLLCTASRISLSASFTASRSSLGGAVISQRERIVSLDALRLLARTSFVQDSRFFDRVSPLPSTGFLRIHFARSLSARSANLTGDSICFSREDPGVAEKSR